MADIELVIKIPEDEYRWIIKSDKTVFADIASKECMLHAIKNGTPLPKGHGDLVDRSQALRTDCFGDGHDGLRAFHEYADYAKMRKYLQNIPAIIPAEKDGD